MTYEQLHKEWAVAMKNRDSRRKATISTLLETAKKIAIEDRIKEPIEAHVDKAISKEIRLKQEQISTCPANRPDLLVVYKEQLSIMKEYEPARMSETEIYNIVKPFIDELIENGITPTKKNMGAIMKKVLPIINGKADNSLVSSVVLKLLS